MSADQKEEGLPKDFDLDSFVPHSSYVNSLLTDLYQLTMAYAYFINGIPDQQATFDLFFRKCPFNGEYTIFAGLDDVLRFLNTFSFTEQQIKDLKLKFPHWDTKFPFLINKKITYTNFKKKKKKKKKKIK
ncbi:nicotinate phosphoribosyltransferase [Reticulomyxa filosa]|uniref:Nicotinate phosphoribosyltransferase n=1 Tax=Reticulomyxa filosa TaxID=46433 RepID=X6NFP2_RETFI|nr:nicotinate phosphoribosyltransferase [Reticulomyxa filosa]|eukprot:ETO24162.1 nicotinate phosphoribosyltransferase [Reticulomyxa filosa]